MCVLWRRCVCGGYTAGNERKICVLNGSWRYFAFDLAGLLAFFGFGDLLLVAAFFFGDAFFFAAFALPSPSPLLAFFGDAVFFAFFTPGFLAPAFLGDLAFGFLADPAAFFLGDAFGEPGAAAWSPESPSPSGLAGDFGGDGERAFFGAVFFAAFGLAVFLADDLAFFGDGDDLRGVLAGLPPAAFDADRFTAFLAGDLLRDGLADLGLLARLAGARPRAAAVMMAEAEARAGTRARETDDQRD